MVWDRYSKKILTKPSSMKTLILLGGPLELQKHHLLKPAFSQAGLYHVKLFTLSSYNISGWKMSNVRKKPFNWDTVKKLGVF